MKIYLAARYSRFLEMQDYRKQLHSKGHIVTSRWINGSHQLSDREAAGTLELAERIRFAYEDYADVLAAECTVSFTEPPRSNHSRGGRHVELGISLQAMRRTIVIGHRENLFHWLPMIEFYETWQEALNHLETT